MVEQPEFAAVSLPNNVQDAMRDNLPSQVSKILREQLEKGDKAIIEAELRRAEVMKVEKLLDEHGDIKHARRKLAKEKEIHDERDRSLVAAKLEQELFMAEYTLGVERKFSARLETILAGLVRNTEWRESIRDCSKTNGYKEESTRRTVSATKEAM